MKKLLTWLLLTAMMLGMGGCAGESASTETTAIPSETAAAEVSAPETQATVPETEPAVLEEAMYLKVSSITFSLVGESDDIYLGLVPRELITWESEDPSVVSVENGVLTANGIGTTTIRATYADRQLECTAGCLAATQEELDALDYEILSTPKRLPPEVDLSAPCTYFENCAIVGDSIVYMMMQEESKGDYLGNILFLTKGGTSLNGFVKGFKNLYYQGSEMNLEDIIAKSQVERMYILIGSNDIGSDPQREIFFENWNIMLKRIREESPDVEIVMVSNIPQCANEFESKQGHFIKYNSLIAEYNTKLRDFAAENGCLYFDLHYYVVDHCNRMSKDYNLDGYHLNSTGYMQWMKLMRYYAQYELDGGILS